MLATETKPIKVLCVDDDDLLATSVRFILKPAKSIQWIGQLRTAEHLLETARENCPDIVLLDIYMPGKDPFEALRELSEACPNTRAIMFSGYVSQRLVDRSIEAGAWGYVSKHDADTTLISAIRRVASGEFVLGPDVRQELGGPDRAPFDREL